MINSKVSFPALLLTILVFGAATPAWSIDKSKLVPGAPKPQVPGNLPDLKVDSVVMYAVVKNAPVIAELKWGEIMTPVCEYSNVGTAELKRKWKVTFLIDGKVEGVIAQENVPAGGHLRVDMGYLSITGYSLGTHTLECWLDREGVTGEKNLSNNRKSYTFKVVNK
jgi:hypothetical protein